MGAICNGMSLCGLRAFGATFFVFTDYMRPSIRLAAIMGLPVFYIFTHDSIGVGEDGPTHQPIEHLAALRAIPNLLVIRPADANEVAEAYKVDSAAEKSPRRVGPDPAELAHARPRRNTPRPKACGAAATCWPMRGLSRFSCHENGTVPERHAPDVILIGTGSEVSLCVDAYEKLKAEGVKARVVSMPSWELFDAQPANPIATPSCRRRSPAAWRSSLASSKAGSDTSARPANSSACAASAPPPPSACC